MADLIDRDALGVSLFPLGKKDAADIYKIIMGQPAVNRWISCSERMPDDNQDVLYVWRSENGAVSVLYGWHFNIRGLGSAWHQSGCGMHRPDEEVTHWMPLPMPPEVKT